MTEQTEKWMPGREELGRAVNDCTLDYEALRALVRTAVEKALAEAEERFVKALDLANATYKQQEARHKREVIEARINEVTLIDVLRTQHRLLVLRTALAALTTEVNNG